MLGLVARRRTGCDWEGSSVDMGGMEASIARIDDSEVRVESITSSLALTHLETESGFALCSVSVPSFPKEKSAKKSG